MNEEFTGGYNPEDGVYYAKGTFDNEIEYNNEVICLVNHVESNFQEIGKNIKEERFGLVEQLIAEFANQNTQNIVALDQLGAYEGDHKLLNTAKAYLEEINNMLQTDYAKILHMIMEQSATKQELASQQEKFGKRYHDSTAQLQKAFQEFGETYFQSDEFDPEIGGYNPEDGRYYPKGTYDNEAEYYNEVLHAIYYKDEYIAYISQALNAGQFAEADKALEQLEQQNQQSKETLQKLGDYEGDAKLLDASLAYIDQLQALIQTQYKPMIAAYKAEDMSEFTAKQDTLMLKLEEADHLITEALEQFIATYDQNHLTQDPANYEQENYTGMERKEYDPNNPYLQPIHGISIEDYAAASSKMANGMTEDQVVKALGVERPQWDEANQLWQQRMQQDTEMVVIGLFGEYFALAESHPKFQNLEDDSSMAANPENLARIKEDPEFYLDLSAAMQAAYNYGIDGAQWLRENYGLSLGDFQSVAMQWAYSPAYIELMSQMPERIKAHEDKFAEEMGGNITDDIEF